MRAAVGAFAAVVALTIGPAPAWADTPVHIQYDAFAPSQVDLLPGESADWMNMSDRQHTVTADDGSYDSGPVGGGAEFSRRFDSEGAYPYHCTLHAGMTGEVDVRRVILDALPPAPTPTGARVQLTGRARGPVSIERAEDGSYREVARATPGGDARWSAWVTADHAADYRAVSGSGVSQTRRLLVSDRKVRLRATRRGVVVTVSPALPGGRVTLQMDLRERFGWWPVARRRLDYVSRATFTVRRRGRVRAILVDRDGWTPLATSVVLGFRPRR